VDLSDEGIRADMEKHHAKGEELLAVAARADKKEHPKH
jgi:hypothetical protein